MIKFVSDQIASLARLKVKVLNKFIDAIQSRIKEMAGDTQYFELINE